jgi:hypothetical protein
MQLMFMLMDQMTSPSNSLSIWFSTSDSCTFDAIAVQHWCFAGLSLPSAA